MSKDLVVFENSEFGRITVVEHEGDAWFVASEVAGILGYAQTNSMNKLIDKEDKTIRAIQNGGMYLKQALISESGLYDAIFGSHLPTAKAFKRWVTKEVLPSIRKTGSYIMDEPPKKISEAITESGETFAAYFKVCQLIGCDNNVAAISANQAVNKRFGVNLLEDLGLTHLVALKQEIFFTPTELGSRNNISARAFNELLGSIGMQRKENKKWIPTEQGLEFCKILDTGKKRGSGAPITQVKWSEKVMPLLPSMN